MSDVAIRVENLSKLYHIGAKQDRPDTIREWLTGRFRRTQHDARDEALWALKDVSFEVKRGEVVGVIGRNGAGKSTLLKILSRITEPTSGRVEMNGRVGSLLEVGTGFHPELTGRENVYLSGAILGMRRVEIDRRFDEIVNFSGVEKFIDTPFKRYSSGMKVRLGFAVAAHLESEILIVDEVLAVGDIEFQRKCLGMMGMVAAGGRTVLFVSHNMNAIRNLCPRSLQLEHGKIANVGRSDEIISNYISVANPKATAVFVQDNNQGKTAVYTSIRLLDRNGMVSSELAMGQGLIIDLNFVVNSHLIDPSFGILINSTMGERLLRLITKETEGKMPTSKEGGNVQLLIESLNLMPGTYSITVGLSDMDQQIEYLEHAIKFVVVPSKISSTGRYPKSGTSLIYSPCTWTSSYE